MDIFIIGITGVIGGLLAQKLRSRGDTVRGLVRRDDQQTALARQGIHAQVGDLACLTAADLAAAFGDGDAIVFSAGSNGGSKEVTRAIGGDGVATAIQAAGIAVSRSGLNWLILRPSLLVDGRGGSTPLIVDAAGVAINSQPHQLRARQR